jgi:hypothetical protein
MTTARAHHTEPTAEHTQRPGEAVATQRRAKRWMVALTTLVVAVPVGITVEQVAVHGAAFFVCRAPAVGATGHMAPPCPKP